MKAISSLLLVLGLVALSSCTVLTVIQGKPNLSTLTSMVNSSGLADDLNTKTPITLFAPNNAAWEALDQGTLDQLESNNSLANALLYHVINQRLPTSNFTNDQLVATLDPRGNQVRLNVYPQGTTTVYTVNGAKIVEANVESTNGLIQVINRVLVPPSESITSSLASDSSFSTLLSLITAAELRDELSNGTFTLFAPTNAAFASVFTPEALEMLSSSNISAANRALLVRLLTYHVVSGTWFSAGLTNDMKLPTLLGSNLTINVDNEGVAVNQYSDVTRPDWIQTDGVIHVVDAVLFPRFTIYEINQLEALTSLNSAIVSAGLLQSVNTTGETNFTEFAPTNQAFADFEGANATGNLTTEDILNYHLINRVWFTSQLTNNQMLTSVLGPTIRINVYNATSQDNATEENATTTNIYTANCALLVAKDARAINGVVQVVNKVLVPPTTNILGGVEETDELSSLNTFLNSLNFTTPDGIFTLFAPSNAAFNSLDSNTRSLLASNDTFLEQVLLHHVVSGVYCSSGLSNQQSLRTLEGSNVIIRIQGGAISVNSANITNPDLMQTNGVIHIINKVLIPGDDGPVGPQNPNTGTTSPVGANDASALTSGLFLTVLALITALRLY